MSRVAWGLVGVLVLLGVRAFWEGPPSPGPPPVPPRAPLLRPPPRMRAEPVPLGGRLLPLPAPPAAVPPVPREPWVQQAWDRLLEAEAELRAERAAASVLDAPERPVRDVELEQQSRRAQRARELLEAPGVPDRAALAAAVVDLLGDDLLADW